MNRWKRRLCYIIVQLDRIPRYGRVYTWNPKTVDFGPAKWKWHRRGYWGIRMLDDLGWLWEFVDEVTET